MNIKQVSIDAFSTINNEADRYIAGGVVSMNRKVEPAIVFDKALGSKLYDIEGKEYVDYHAAFAPHLLGHNNATVNEAVLAALRENRSLYGSGTNSLEIELSRLMCSIVPSLERLQITNTGSEATAHAIRLSRAFTKRTDIILTLGGYNGWHNEVCRAVMPALKDIGQRVSPGEYPFVPLSAGIPESTKRHVHIVNFNDLDSIEYVMRRYPIACVLTEPVLQNIGVIKPAENYLQGIMNLCEKYGAVGIFDEVKTGFRSAIGGYQRVAGVTPHLSIFGKAIANGYPLGVIGGKKEILDLFHTADPLQRVLIAGTYNAHPINTAAAIATIKLLHEEGAYETLHKKCLYLYANLEKIYAEKGIAVSLVHNASAFCIYYMEKSPQDLHDILNHHNFSLDIEIRKQLIGKGIYNFPLPCKQSSVSFAHSREDIDVTLDITRQVIQSL